MNAVADTSFVIALGNIRDMNHERCFEVYEQANLIYLPQTTLAEVGYFLSRSVGNRGMIKFLQTLLEGDYTSMPLVTTDFVRVKEILEQYIDNRIDFVDASVMAVAERLNITHILTLDRRDFSIVRPRHTTHFEILP